jgi:hypothetical protein
LAHPFDLQFALPLSLLFLHNQGVPSLTCPVISVGKDDERKKTALHLADSSDEFRAILNRNPINWYLRSVEYGQRSSAIEADDLQA